jgi:hypothetical protein
MVECFSGEKDLMPYSKPDEALKYYLTHWEEDGGMGWLIRSLADRASISVSDAFALVHLCDRADAASLAAQQRRIMDLTEKVMTEHEGEEPWKP